MGQLRASGGRRSCRWLYQPACILPVQSKRLLIQVRTAIRLDTAAIMVRSTRVAIMVRSIKAATIMAWVVTTGSRGSRSA